LIATGTHLAPVRISEIKGAGAISWAQQRAAAGKSARAAGGINATAFSVFSRRDGDLIVLSWNEHLCEVFGGTRPAPISALDKLADRLK
jgi:hypothetical protein